jgi:1-acyl-sn-glycerol-3-phosphate acyltransferase
VTLLRILLTGTAFFLFWTGGAILSWIVIPAISVYHRRDPVLRARRCREVVSLGFRWHIAYMQLCRLVAFSPREIQAQLPRTPFVLVANHPTLIDVVLLLASYPSICCVVKGPLFRSPMVGRLLRQGNHIDAGDGSAFDGAAVVQGAIDRLRAGDPVLIFPEGTRSPEEGLGRFKAGAFVIACRAQAPVIPVLIKVSPRGLMKGMPWYTVPDGTMRFTMSVQPAFDTARYDGKAKALQAETHALFERLIDPRPAVIDAVPELVPAE